MSKRLKIDRDKAEALIFGGAVLGGGGGGCIDEAKRIAKIALERGFSEIISIDELPDDATLLTVSAVGAPSASGKSLKPYDFVRAVELFIEKSGIKIDGLISSEIGALGIVNGWIQSALLGIPVVDAPCNGRAHPLGLMGSMGLHREKRYISIQAVAGGDIEKENRVEAFFKGSIEKVAELVRESAIRAGGMIAVARNPVSAHYVKENGAPGAMKMALRIGEILMDDWINHEEVLKKIFNFLKGEFFIEGKVERVNLKFKKGFDVGSVILKGEEDYEITVMNEYLTLERGNERLATFPDLIMTFDAETARPIISAELKEGEKVYVISVPSNSLILGSGVKDKSLLKKVERIVKKQMLK